MMDIIAISALREAGPSTPKVFNLDGGRASPRRLGVEGLRTCSRLSDTRLVRQGRFGDKPAQWIFDELSLEQRRGDFPRPQGFNSNT